MARGQRRGLRHPLVPHPDAARRPQAGLGARPARRACGEAPIIRVRGQAVRDLGPLSPRDQHGSRQRGRGGHRGHAPLSGV